MRYAIEEWQQSMFSAGQIASAGHYLRVDVEGCHVIVLASEDLLPASLDGHVAEYVRLEDVGWAGLWLTSGQTAA